MTCPDCTEARRNVYCGRYTATCLGCSLRGFSRSTLAFDAVRVRSTAALREAIAAKHPGLAMDEALQGVWDWWKHDRSSNESTTVKG